MKTSSISISKLLAAALLATGVAGSLAQTPAPHPSSSAPAVAVSVPDSMVQPVKRKKIRTSVTRTTVHKRTVTRHRHSHTQSAAAGSTAK